MNKELIKRYHQERYNKLSWWGKQKENLFQVLSWGLALFAGMFGVLVILAPILWSLAIIYVIVHFVLKFW